MADFCWIFDAQTMDGHPPCVYHVFTMVQGVYCGTKQHPHVVWGGLVSWAFCVVFGLSLNTLPWSWQARSPASKPPTPLSHIFSNRFANFRQPSDEMDEYDDGCSREQLKSSSLRWCASAIELWSCDGGGCKLTSPSKWQVYREVLPAMLWRWLSWLLRIGERALLRVGRHCWGPKDER